MNWQECIVIVIGVIVAMIIIRKVGRYICSTDISKCAECDKKSCPHHINTKRHEPKE